MVMSQASHKSGNGAHKVITDRLSVPWYKKQCFASRLESVLGLMQKEQYYPSLLHGAMGACAVRNR